MHLTIDGDVVVCRAKEGSMVVLCDSVSPPLLLAIGQDEVNASPKQVDLGGNDEHLTPF